MKTEELTKEAMQLPKDQRITLAHKLLRSVDAQENPDVADAWNIEIRERIRRYDAGDSVPIPAAEVFAELDRRLKG